MFTLGGSAISWQSSFQDVIALTTTEAEYIVVAESFKEDKWLKGPVGEMCNKVCSVSVHCDNQSTIHLARNQNTFHRRSKHIDIKYNFIRDEVEHKRVILKTIATKDNPTEMMTKPLPTTKFDLCVDFVGLALCLM